MTSNLDIYRAANVLIREHVEDAALEATMRAGAMLEKGNLEGPGTDRNGTSTSGVPLGPGDLGGRETGAVLGDGRYPSEEMISRKAASGNATGRPGARS